MLGFVGSAGSPQAHDRLAFLPRSLDDRLRAIARAAVRAGVNSVVRLSPGSATEEVRTVGQRSFAAFVEHRSQIWPPLVAYVREHPFVVLRLLRAMTDLATTTRVELPLPRPPAEGEDERALLRRRLARRTYEMTLHVAVSSIPKVLAALARDPEPEGFSSRESVEGFLNDLDGATARLEFGVLVCLRLLELEEPALGHVFHLASEDAQIGADRQHVLVRSVIRSILGPEAEAASDEAPGADTNESVPPDALFDDWVRAVLAA